MSDNIDTTGNNGARFAERNGVAWHKLGQRIPDGDVTVQQAIELADADYDVVTQPLTYTSPTTGLPTESGRVAIIRPEYHGSPEEYFGEASTQFRPLQNRELAALLEPIAKEWPVETVGAIRRGADLFITLRNGSADIGGDQVDNFFFVWNSHDGTASLKFRDTPIRVVCQNTCIMGDRAANIALDVRHTQNILRDATYARDLIVQLKKASATTMEKLGALVNIRLTADQVSEVLEIAYPLKEVNKQLDFYKANKEVLTEEQTDKMLNLEQQALNDRRAILKSRLAVFESYENFNQTNPITSKTGWALYNAVTEAECWKGGNSEAETARSVLVGTRGATMARAYGALVALK